jgi:hypothetical protein
MNQVRLVKRTGGAAVAMGVGVGVGGKRRGAGLGLLVDDPGWGLAVAVVVD